LVDFTTSCGFLELGFPRKARLFATASSDSTRLYQFAADVRERAQVLMGVDELWRWPSWKHGRLRIVGDDFSNVFVLLDDPECKSVDDFVGVAFFDAHQTWGEIALASRRAHAAFSKDYIQ
jgi:hypothetical protein